MYVIIDLTGIVVQSVRAPPCQGGSCGFEPRQSRTRTINSSLYSLWKRGRHQDLIPSGWGIFFLLLFASYLSSDKSSIDWWGGNIGDWYKWPYYYIKIQLSMERDTCLTFFLIVLDQWNGIGCQYFYQEYIHKLYWFIVRYRMHLP